MESKDKQEISIEQAIQGFEDKTLNPKEFGKDVLRECALAMKLRGYSNAEIGAILQITSRSVQRYIKQERESHSLIASSDFQSHFMFEALRNLNSQYYRLIRLSYSDTLSNSERVRAIFFASRIQLDMISILERLGYLNQFFTNHAAVQNTKEKEENKKKIEAKKNLAEMFEKDFGKLSTVKKNDLVKFKIEIDAIAKEKESQIDVYLAKGKKLKPEEEQKLNKFSTEIQDFVYESLSKKLHEFLSEDHEEKF